MYTALLLTVVLYTFPVFDIESENGKTLQTVENLSKKRKTI